MLWVVKESRYAYFMSDFFSSAGNARMTNSTNGFSAARQEFLWMRSMEMQCKAQSVYMPIWPKVLTSEPLWAPPVHHIDTWTFCEGLVET